MLLEILATIGKVLIGLFGLGIMIFVHELGHLAAAKLLRVKVETFSLGYGKKIFGFKKGDTTYQIALFPLGGFCKMKGEHLFIQALEKNLDRIPADSDSYYNTPPWKRILISLAGPLFNVIFAILMFTLLYWIGFAEYTYDNRIILASEFSRPGQEQTALPADKAGLQTEDRITSIDGATIRHFYDLQRIISMAPNREMDLTFERGGVSRTTKITPLLDTDTARGYIGIVNYAEPVIDRITTAEMSALNPWLKSGDRIMKIGDTYIENQLDLIRSFEGKPESLPAVILRDGEYISHALHVSYNDATGGVMIGLSFVTRPFRTPDMNFFQAMGKAVNEVLFNISTIINFFSLIPQKINISNAIGGPIITTYYIGEAAGQGLEKGLDQGIVQFIQFLCALSVILFFMNLLPLPVLDGGFVILFLIEWIRRKPFRPRFIFRYQMIGVGILAMLIIFVVFNDISKLINL